MNRLLACVKSRGRLKRGDRQLVAYYAREAAIPKALGRRRVSYLVTDKRYPLPDPSNILKSLEDALVHAGLLVDDGAAWYEIGSVCVAVGKGRQTVITLEDVELSKW